MANEPTTKPQPVKTGVDVAPQMLENVGRSAYQGWPTPKK